MARDYWVLWTVDLPTPRSLGLGGELLPWPASDRPWPSTAAESAELGYPDAGDPLYAVIGLASSTLGALPHHAATALAGRKVAREMTVRNDRELAIDLAEAGDGVCFDEAGQVLFPRAGHAPDPDAARRRVAARLWSSLRPRA